MNLLSTLLSWFCRVAQYLSTIKLEDFVENVFFSLVAALIFWIIFNYLPERDRKKKIRPKVEFDIYEFYDKLFQYVQLPFIPNQHSPSSFQNKIFAGRIKKEDFETWLQNKCLNESYLYDEMSRAYICIGDQLEKLSLELCEQAKNIYAFIQFLSADEILIIKKITTKIRTYGYIEESGIHLNKATIYYPANPNLAYMATNYFEIYELFLNLQKIVLKYKYIDTSINNYMDTKLKWAGINYAYYRGEYQKCLLKFWFFEIQNKFPEELWHIKFLCLYKTEKRPNALIFLEDQLRINQLKLIYIRNCFDDLYLQEDVKEVLIKSRGETEYTEMVQCLKSEEATVNSIVDQAGKIKKHYSENIGERRR